MYTSVYICISVYDNGWILMLNIIISYYLHGCVIECSSQN